MSKRIPLSVLDQSPICAGRGVTEALNETFALAKLTEQLNYSRFWVSEHHGTNGLVGVSPEVLLARIGAETSRIRIGSAGIMLPHYSPYKVAENFKLLGAMYPGRVDCGVGRAPGGHQHVANALRYGSPLGPEYFPNKVADLDALLRDQSPPTPGMERARAMPVIETAPELWMLGSSEDSAHLAGRMGLPYSVAYFINPRAGDDILRTYRREFRPSPNADKPYASLGVFVLCAETEAEAKRLESSRGLWLLGVYSGQDNPVQSVETALSQNYNEQEQSLLRKFVRSAAIGTPAQVKEQLEALVERFDADELVVVSVAHDFAARCRSYELLAEVWGL
ncbi:MAG: hypothetical protein JWM78_2675 [Verrucomicrobiaceae bacterium]|nr:hypothetical protein [Verrucomicrobiaceae bacterium]